MPVEANTYDYHRRQLDAWLDAYRLDRALRDESASDPVRNVEDCLSGTQGPAPMASQIRLLPPIGNATPQIERPVYACLLPGTRPDCITFVPFSRFRLPATPQEWKTGLRPGPLQVLCLWNAHTCRVDNLRASWQAGTITEPKRQKIATLLQTLNPLHDWPSRHFGPPLLHPLDPRQTYLQEERLLMHELLADRVGTSSNTIHYEIPQPDIQLLRAAESADTGEQPPGGRAR